MDGLDIDKIHVMTRHDRSDAPPRIWGGSVFILLALVSPSVHG
jgi:hypothetical protein